MTIDFTSIRDQAAQCCEHLNRALVVNRETMVKYGLEQVNAHRDFLNFKI